MGATGPSDIYKLVKMIMERNYQPVIIFAFSKRECEALGQQMARLDFNNGAVAHLAAYSNDCYALTSHAA